MQLLPINQKASAVEAKALFVERVGCKNYALGASFTETLTSIM